MGRGGGVAKGSRAPVMDFILIKPFWVTIGDVFRDDFVRLHGVAFCQNAGTPSL